jgi:hypothetical protein
MVSVQTVTGRAQLQTDAAVHAERVQHVIEKGYVGLDVDRAPVELQVEIDRRLVRRPDDVRAARRGD